MSRNVHYLLLFLAVTGISPLAKGQVITTIVNVDTIPGYNGDGIACGTAELQQPAFIAADAAGNMYITDQGNSRIRKIDASGIITTIAGTGTNGFSGNGGPGTAAQIAFPDCITPDAAGNVYFIDNTNCVRKINTSGIISVFAGDTGLGSVGFGGDGGPATAAILDHPGGLAADAAGNVYIADYGNGRIRKVNTSGIISTYAGDSLNRIGASAIKLDASGNLYFIANNSYVRKLDTNGAITTIAGTASHTSHTIGDGGPATDAYLNSPGDIAVDAAGNIYISDDINARIRMVNTAGIISTFAGNGVFGFSGDGGLATLAAMNTNAGINFDRNWNLLIADFGNNCIRSVSSVESVQQINNTDMGMVVYPNPCNGVFTCNIPAQKNEDATITIMDMAGNKVKEIHASANNSINVKMDVPAGIYFVVATAIEGRWCSKIVVN